MASTARITIKPRTTKDNSPSSGGPLSVYRATVRCLMRQTGRQAVQGFCVMNRSAEEARNEVRAKLSPDHVAGFDFISVQRLGAV